VGSKLECGTGRSDRRFRNTFSHYEAVNKIPFSETYLEHVKLILLVRNKVNYVGLGWLKARLSTLVSKFFSNILKKNSVA
jgi:hypothetical protein